MKPPSNKLVAGRRNSTVRMDHSLRLAGIPSSDNLVQFGRKGKGKQGVPSQADRANHLPEQTRRPEGGGCRVTTRCSSRGEQDEPRDDLRADPATAGVPGARQPVRHAGSGDTHPGPHEAGAPVRPDLPAPRGTEPDDRGLRLRPGGRAVRRRALRQDAGSRSGQGPRRRRRRALYVLDPGTQLEEGPRHPAPQLRHAGHQELLPDDDGHRRCSWCRSGRG